MVDAGGKPLPSELGDCLRTTLESLALPPLGEDNSIDIHYDFTFD